ncbi:MAG: radical SAM protein [Synergistaceae bacterium]|jgi:radical SAM protein with 4Fe4S-binding SPASM domain|nr:radical SAM protein [Synergistaceae bacterium]
MKQFRLRENFAFRGWDKLPYAVVDLRNAEAVFLTLGQFKPLYDFLSDDISLEDESLELYEDMARMGIERGFLEECESKTHLASYQKYKRAGCRYIKSVQWSITNACNLRCRHCFVNASDVRQEELSLQDCLRIIDQLESANVAAVSLTGGEPLIREDFWDIVDALLEKRITVTDLFTNSLLVDECFLDECSKRHLSWVFCISFDGVGCHDWLRGMDGVESRAVDAIKRIKSAGFRVAISSALHRDNLASLCPTYELLKELGVDAWKMSPVMHTGRWVEEADKRIIGVTSLYDLFLDVIGWYRHDSMPMALSLGGFFTCLRGRSEWSSPYHRNAGTERSLNLPVCGACRTHIYLASNGRVLPCIPTAGTCLEEDAPNIMDVPLTEILGSSKFFELIDTRLGASFEQNQICADCEFRLECGPCRASALHETGHFYGPDKSACVYWNGGYPEKIKRVFETSQHSGRRPASADTSRLSISMNLAR